jgi:gas vesicle protein
MSNTKTVLGFVAGAAVGALAGILLAPDKGSNTRKKIAGKAGDVSDSLKSSFDDFMDGLKKAYSSGKEDVKEGAEELAEHARAKMNALKAEAKANLS